jgi:bifunctional non-homologous end joining protein LigD
VKDESVTTWVKPSLVAEVKFTEWTSSGEMRHPVYLGLRADKRAEEVVHEREKPRG